MFKKKKQRRDAYDCFVIKEHDKAIKEYKNLGVNIYEENDFFTFSNDVDIIHLSDKR